MEVLTLIDFNIGGKNNEERGHMGGEPVIMGRKCSVICLKSIDSKKFSLAYIAYGSNGLKQ